MTAQSMKKTINEYNTKLRNQNKKQDEKPGYIATNDDLIDMESSLVKTYDSNFLVHAFVIPNYTESEALMRDTIGHIAIHK